MTLARVSTLTEARKMARKWILGPANVPQQCLVGGCDPQDEVRVWLEGKEGSLDVTRNNFVASASPLTIGVNVGRQPEMRQIAQTNPLLMFRATRSGQLLGQIHLKLTSAMDHEEEHLCFFQTRGSKNYCLPGFRLWLRHTEVAYRKWVQERRSGSQRIRMRTRELQSLFAFYICPRPIGLITVCHQGQVNLFPMDLMGPFGSRHFALALHNTSAPLPLLEESRRLAVSSVPLDRSRLAFELGGNHKQTAVDPGAFPFKADASERFALPVPQFSPRVRELQVERIHRLGSHTLFIGAIVSDLRRSQDVEVFQVHGFYHAWKQASVHRARNGC